MVELVTFVLAGAIVLLGAVGVERGPPALLPRVAELRHRGGHVLRDVTEVAARHAHRKVDGGLQVGVDDLRRRLRGPQQDRNVVEVEMLAVEIDAALAA